MKDTPLIIQSDGTLLLDVHHKDAEACRADLIAFCSLVKSPEHVHTYRIDAISLWNAVALGMTSAEILSRLERWSRYALPDSLSFFVRDTASRFGMVTMEEDGKGDGYRLSIGSERAEREIMESKALSPLLSPLGGRSFRLRAYDRGQVKLLLVKMGYPVDDRIPLAEGALVPMAFRATCLSGAPFSLRGYQKSAADALMGDGRGGSGYGVIVLPCGSGKTIIGMAIMERLKTRTLILTTNVAAVHQWIDELRDKMDIPPAMIGEYSGERKEKREVTVCTYQVLTWRENKSGPFPHLDLLRDGGWGLIIYDEDRKSVV